MKEFVLLVALGLFAPLASAYGPPAPPSGYYAAKKTYASFAAWCVDFACPKDETYSYYNSAHFYYKREQCHCSCPTPENGEVYYPVVMDYRMLVADANGVHNGSVSDLKNYCPHVNFKGRVFEIYAWDGNITVTANSENFSWNPHVACTWKTSIGTTGTLILTRVMVDTLKKFNVVILCHSPEKVWALYSPYQTMPDPTTLKNILQLLQDMNMDTSKIYKPDFSRCGGSGYEYAYGSPYSKK